MLISYLVSATITSGKLSSQQPFHSLLALYPIKAPFNVFEISCI